MFNASKEDRFNSGIFSGVKRRFAALFIAFGFLVPVVGVTATASPAAADNVMGCVDVHWGRGLNTAGYFFYNSAQRGATRVSCYWTYNTTCRRPNGSLYNLYYTVTVGRSGSPVQFRSVKCGSRGRVVATSVATYPYF